MRIKKYISLLSFGSIILGITTLFNIENPQKIINHLKGYEYLGKQNVFFQKGKSDCGPAALMNVFQHYGIESSLDEIQLISGTTTHGTSMLGLQQMAEIKGLKATGWHYTWKDFMRATLPIIVFMDNDHYTVVDSFYNDGDLRIIDPARGVLKMSKRKFNRIWSGETLQIERVDSKESTLLTKG